MDAVLVTGGTGFIGRRLVARLLSAGRRVRVLARRDPGAIWSSPVEVVVGDVRDRRSLSEACTGASGIFHLAAKVHDTAERGDGSEHETVTVEGTRSLVDAAAAAGVNRLIFCSSLAVFGRVDRGVHDESTPARPTSAYGRAKLAAEEIVFDCAERFSMHAACVRPAMVYGPGCKGNLPRLIRLIESGRCPQVPDVGTRRSVAHVEHVVDALVLTMERPEARGQSYIVADREAYSLREMIAIIATALGRQPPGWTVPAWALRFAAAFGDIGAALLGRRIAFDSEELDKLVGAAWFSGERLARELQFQYRTTLERSMPELIAAWRAS